MSEQRDSSGEGRHLQEKTCHAGRGSMLAFCSRMCRLQSQQLELLVCLCTSVLLVIGTRKLQQDGCCDALHAGWHQTVVGLLLLNVYAMVTEKIVTKTALPLYGQRHAASCGLALGALTLPWVLLSGTTCDIDDQYGTCTAERNLSLCQSMVLSSVVVLLYLAGMQLWAAKRSGTREYDSTFKSGLVLSGIVMYGYMIAYVENTMLEILLGGLNALVFHSIMVQAPYTFTLGEGLALSTGTVHMMRVMLSMLFGGNQYSSPVALFIMWTAGLSTSTFLTLFTIHKISKDAYVSDRTRNTETSVALVFNTGAMAILATFAFHRNLSWLLWHILNDTTRIHIIIYWTFILALGVPSVLLLSRKQYIPNIIVRKAFHLIAILLFVPSLVMDSGLLGIALSIALCAFLAIEIVRISNINGVSNHINSFLGQFIDARDQGTFIVTHITLLLGLALPIWLSQPWVHKGSIAPYAGIIATGVGDAAASIAGTFYGKTKIARDTKKTIEGTAASVGAMILCWMVLAGISSKVVTGLGWIVVASVISSTLEAATDQFDNLFISLHHFALIQCLEF